MFIVVTKIRHGVLEEKRIDSARERVESHAERTETNAAVVEPVESLIRGFFACRNTTYFNLQYQN